MWPRTLALATADTYLPGHCHCSPRCCWLGGIESGWSGGRQDWACDVLGPRWHTSFGRGLCGTYSCVCFSAHEWACVFDPCNRSWSCLSNERERVPRSVRPHHRWGQSRPTFAAERTRDQSGAVSSAQWDTFEEVTDTEEEDNDGSGNTIDLGDLQDDVRDELEALASCMGWRERCPDCRRGRFSAGNGISQTCGLQALPIVQAARRGASESNRHSHGSSRSNVKTRQCLDVTVYLAVRVNSVIMMTDQLRSSEGLNVPGPYLSNAEVRTCKQSWTSGKLAAFAMPVTGKGRTWSGRQK